MNVTAHDDDIAALIVMGKPYENSNAENLSIKPYDYFTKINDFDVTNATVKQIESSNAQLLMTSANIERAHIYCSDGHEINESFSYKDKTIKCTKCNNDINDVNKEHSQINTRSTYYSCNHLNPEQKNIEYILCNQCYNESLCAKIKSIITNRSKIHAGNIKDFSQNEMKYQQLFLFSDEEDDDDQEKEDHDPLGFNEDDEEKNDDKNDNEFDVLQKPEEDITLILLDYENIMQFIPTDDLDGDCNEFILNSYKWFYRISSLSQEIDKMESYKKLNKFKSLIHLEDNKDELATINYNYMYNLLHYKYVNDIHNIKTQNIYVNYYFNKIQNSMAKQIFVGIIQMIFTGALLYQIYVDYYQNQIFDEILESEYFERNIIAAVMIFYLTCSKILPAIDYFSNDMKIIKQYFTRNPLNLFLNLFTNSVVAVLIPIITFGIILSAESIIDIVLNSTAVIFVIDLDDEAVGEGLDQQWEVNAYRNLKTKYINHFGSNFNTFSKANIGENILSDFWDTIKDNDNVSAQISNDKNNENNENADSCVNEKCKIVAKEIGELIIMPLILFWKAIQPLFPLFRALCSCDRPKQIQEKHMYVSISSSEFTTDLQGVGSVNIEMTNTAQETTDEIKQNDEKKDAAKKIADIMTALKKCENTIKEAEYEEKLQCIVYCNYKEKCNSVYDKLEQLQKDNENILLTSDKQTEEYLRIQILKMNVLLKLFDFTKAKELFDDINDKAKAIACEPTDMTVKTITKWHSKGYDKIVAVKQEGMNAYYDGIKELNYVIGRINDWAMWNINDTDKQKSTNEPQQQEPQEEKEPQEEEKRDIDIIQPKSNEIIDGILHRMLNKAKIALQKQRNEYAYLILKLEMFQILRKLNECLMKEKQKQINDQKQGEFHTLIQQELNIYLKDYAGNAAAANEIEFMLIENNITAATFKCFTQHEFCDLVVKYYNSTTNVTDNDMKDKAKILWEQITNKLRNFIAVKQWENKMNTEMGKLESDYQQLQIRSSAYAQTIQKTMTKLHKNKLWEGKLYAHFYDDRIVDLDVSKENIKIFNDYIKKITSSEQFKQHDQHYNMYASYFYWMRGRCRLKLKKWVEAGKDFDQAIICNKTNEGLFRYYNGCANDGKNSIENAKKDYKNGFKSLQKQVTKYFIYSLQAKVYCSFYKFAHKDEKNNLIINKHKNDIDRKSFMKQLSVIFDDSKALMNLFISEQENYDKLSIEKLHDIFDNDLLLDNIAFYRYFTPKLEEWFRFAKYIPEKDEVGYENLNAFLFDFDKDQKHFSVKSVLIGAMRHVYDCNRKLKKTDKPLDNTKSKRKQLLNWLPKFGQSVFGFYSSSVNGETLEDTLNTNRGRTRLWIHELTEIAEKICERVTTSIGEIDTTGQNSSSSVKVNESGFNFEDNDKISDVEKITAKREFGKYFAGSPFDFGKNENMMKCIIYGKKKKIPLMQYFNDSRYRLMIEMNTAYIDDKIMREIVFEDDKNVSDYGLGVAAQFCNKLGYAKNQSNVHIKINDSMKEYKNHIENIVNYIKKECIQFYPFQLDLWIIPKDWKEVDENGKETPKVPQQPIQIDDRLKTNNLYYKKQPSIWNNDYSSDQDKIDTVRDKLFKYVTYKMNDDESVAKTISNDDLTKIKQFFESEAYDSDAIELSMESDEDSEKIKQFFEKQKSNETLVSNVNELAIKLASNELAIKLGSDELKKGFMNDKQKTIDIVFRKIFNGFVDKLKQLNDQSVQNRRICVIIDRRNTFDMFYIFDPPEGTNQFDVHKLPELYFERSAKYPIFPVLRDNTNGEHPIFGLFTTFHIESSDNIKAYQYWNRTQSSRIGGRFFSVDMINIWKNYFVMNDINKSFVMNTDLNQLKMMDIPDIEFEKWYNENVDNFRKTYNFSLTKLRHDKTEREEKQKLIEQIEKFQVDHFMGGLNQSDFDALVSRLPDRFKIIFLEIPFEQRTGGKEKLLPFEALVEIAKQCLYE